MIGDRHDLDVYLQFVNETIQTTKMASELWFASPAPRQIHQNDRFVRSLICAGLGSVTPGGSTDSVTAPWRDRGTPDAARVRSAYWAAATRGRDVAVHFGAAGHKTLGEYFTVDPGRSGEAALARARRAATSLSPADYVLRGIDAASDAGGALPAQSCRKVMATLARDWPELIRAHGGPSGTVLGAAGLLREFSDSIAARTPRRRGPQRASAGTRAGDPPVLLTAAHARELAATYMLGRYCFTAQEYAMARTLVAMPRLQSALLAVQLRLTAGSLEPLGRLLARFGTPRVLLPFTELFVNAHGYHRPGLDLAPNPKLITVLCNNVVPAIAGELLRAGARAEDLDSGTIRAGVAAARRRHVFEIVIALFNQAGGAGPDAVALSGFNTRVCPALVPFSALLEHWLPRYFDCFSTVSGTACE